MKKFKMLICLVRGGGILGLNAVELNQLCRSGTGLAT